MLPEKLSMQAFGPYVTKQVIDFSAFPHLFLIRGETGSGKTMILDAMTYALYGKSSGGQREDLESMRSRFAKNDLPTIIDFQFQLKGHHYRFSRRIEVKEKRNKEKAVKVSIDAGEVVDGQFLPFFENPKQRNVEEKAVSLIGLTHDQFIQVMVLPQGKFEQLLTSKSEEKQEILRTLFQMEKWEALTISLSEKANGLRKEMEQRKQKIDALFESIQVSGKEEILEQCLLLEKAKTEDTEQLVKLDARLKQLQEQIITQKQLWKQQEELNELSQKQQQLHQEQKRMVQHQSTIDGYHQVEKLLPYYHNKRQYEAALSKRKQEYETAQKQYTAISVQAETLDALQKELQGYQESILQLEKDATQLENCIVQFSQLEQLEKQLLKLQDQQGQAKLAYENQQNLTKAKEQEHEVIYDAYLKDTAMQLREGLKDQEPCPVCGSIHHPYTEVMKQQYVDVIALRNIKEELDQYKEVQQKQQMDLIKINADLDHQQTQLKQRKREYQEKFKDHLVYDSKEKLLQYQKDIQNNIKRLQSQMVQLDKEIQHIILTRDRCERTLVSSEKELQLAKENAQQACQEYELQNVEHIEESMLEQQPDAAFIKQLEAMLKDHQTNQISIKARIEELNHKLNHQTLLDVGPLLDHQEQLEQQQKQLLSDIAEVQSRKEMLQGVLKQSEAMLDAYEASQPSYQKLLHFAKAMRGDNSVGIERYVLGIMLSNITQNANQLLMNVHNGRYQIYRSEHASGKTRKFGLEFSIYDAYTCSMRSVVSLSGGEKFLVSLALSLALSISVQARNGGISFDCMFIDEGFGTLDEHSIADALSILETMSRQKGTIGIISHVEALKENIPDGIEVEKTRKGSTICIRKD